MKYQIPEKTAWMMKQNKHEPTRSYAEELHNFIKDKNISIALEIGNAWGVSTLVLLEHSLYLHSVDSNPKTHAQPEVDANGLTDRFTHHAVKSEDFWKNNEETFDLIFIDGSHNYEDVKNDMFEAWKVLVEGGRMIMDDITHPANYTADRRTHTHAEYGVAFAAWQFVKEHNIKRIDSGSRMLIIDKVGVNI